MIHKPESHCFGYGQRSRSFLHTRLWFCEISTCEEVIKKMQMQSYLCNRSDKSVPIKYATKLLAIRNELISCQGWAFKFDGKFGQIP